MERSSNIDTLKLVAALGVISLHVGSFPEFNPIVGDMLTSAFRWCVPAFIIITGVFLADEKGSIEVTLERLSRFIWLFVFFSAVYSPVFLIKYRLDGLGLEVLLRGTEIHLWYLSSIPIGLIGIHMVRGKNRIALLLSVAILIGYIGANYAFAATHRYYGAVMFLREVVSIPCIYTASLMRQKKLGTVAFLVILASGIAILCFEVSLIAGFGKHAIDIQFSLSTLPIAVGLVGFMMNTRRPLVPSFVSDIGKKESLGIYAWHRMFMIIAASLLTGRPTVVFDGLPSFNLWLLTTAITLCVLCGTRLVLPLGRSLMDGHLPNQKS